MRSWAPGHGIVLEVPRTSDIRRERTSLAVGGEQLPIDIYRPVASAGSRPLSPAVLFVHGDAEPDVLASVMDRGQYISWGAAVAARGMIGVMFAHASTLGLTQTRLVTDQIGRVLGALRTDGPRLGVDPARICVWTCSAGTPYGVVSALQAMPPIRCIVAYYGYLDVRQLRDSADGPVSDADLAAASPLALIEARELTELPPMLVAKAGADRPAINDSIVGFVTRAGQIGARIELLVHPTGRHAFDVLDEDQTSRAIIARTLDFMAEQLRSRVIA